MGRDEDDPNPWKKFSILYELPYWKHCSNRHNLDPMHIEKNVFDNIIGTLLEIPGRTNDHASARKDLKKHGWLPELQPKENADGSLEYPASRFWMSKEKKRLFCQVIKNAKLPQGYASNVARYVHVHEGKITGYKSHDAHFMMHYLLPIAVKLTLSKDVAAPIIRLCNFFKAIWKKTIDPKELVNLQIEIVETLCQFEGIFPLAFFDIMTHLPVHLVEEIRLGGPVAMRTMYAIERYLRECKSNVRNKGHPEASMAEGYMAKECSRLCARYVNRSNASPKSVLHNIDSQPFLPKLGHPIRGRGKTTKKKKKSYHKIDKKTWTQAHQYVLFNCNCDEIERYIT